MTKEVNENKSFAHLRQVYSSLILAAWYKKKIKDSILAQVYADKRKIAGVGYRNSLLLKGRVIKGGDIEVIYQDYLKAFKKGVYNFIKEETDPITQETIPRKYFSGGLELHIDQAMVTTSKLPGFIKTVGLFTVLAALSVQQGHNISSPPILPTSLAPRERIRLDPMRQKFLDGIIDDRILPSSGLDPKTLTIDERDLLRERLIKDNPQIMQTSDPNGLPLDILLTIYTADGLKTLSLGRPLVGGHLKFGQEEWDAYVVSSGLAGVSASGVTDNNFTFINMLYTRDLLNDLRKLIKSLKNGTVCCTPLSRPLFKYCGQF